MHEHTLRCLYTHTPMDTHNHIYHTKTGRKGRQAGGRQEGREGKKEGKKEGMKGVEKANLLK